MSGHDVLDGAPAGLIALVPGYGETLRINGRLRVSDDIATLDVEEALLHCAKAIMRSELWAAPGTPEPPGGAAVPTVEAFLADAPFVAMVSTDADGHTDVSPKGDPPGLIRQIDDTTIAIADRPGNRRTDTLHNLMDDPRIALLAMQPGSRHVAEIRGTARVCTDPALLASMRLRDRTPKAALVIDVETPRASQRARLAPPPSGTRVDTSPTARCLGPPRSGPTMFGATPTPAPEPRSRDGSSTRRPSQPGSPTTTGTTSERPTSADRATLSGGRPVGPVDTTANRATRACRTRDAGQRAP